MWLGMGLTAAHRGGHILRGEHLARARVRVVRVRVRVRVWIRIRVKVWDHGEGWGEGMDRARDHIEGW